MMMLEAMLRDQINLVESRYRCVARIRITEMCPPGMMFLAPFEEDGSVGSTDRRANDGGPTEAIAHPDDWAVIVKQYTDRDWRSSDAMYMGIPVLDDTVEARMKREGRA
jgi:hypothetical protein